MHQAVVHRICEYLDRKAPKVMLKGSKSGIINKQQIRKLNHSNYSNQFFILIDLDNDAACAPAEKQRILGNIRETTDLKLVIAVREAESWLLADRHGMATYLGVARNHLPQQPESEDDPKRTLINIARRSRSRRIRETIVPSGTAVQGPEYNSKISEYVSDCWNIDAAKSNSDSLTYLCQILDENLPPSS